jgi:hypothetical protein
MEDLILFLKESTEHIGISIGKIAKITSLI